MVTLPVCDEQRFIFNVNEKLPGIPLKIFFSQEFTRCFLPAELSSAINRVIRSADVFGARIAVSDDTPEMVFLPYRPRTFQVFDFATIEEYQAHYVSVQESEINNRDRLWHIFIFSIAGSCYHVHFCFNHIIFDGISGLLLNERILSALSDNDETPRWHPYADHLDRIKQYRCSDQYLSDKAFWDSRFDELSRCDYVFPEIRSIDYSSSKALVVDTGEEFKSELLSFCADHRISPPTLIMSVLAQIVSVTTGRKRFYFEAPSGNRSGADEKNSIGAYEIGVPVVFDFHNTESALDLIGSVRQQLREHYKHKNYDWVERYSELHESSYNPYIPQISFSYFCANQQPSSPFASLRHRHPDADLMPITLYVSDTLNWRTITFAYRYWDAYFSEAKILEIHKQLEAGIAGIMRKRAAEP